MDISPLFALRLRTPRLELRLPTDDELVELRELARGGVHPPDDMPFAVAWTDEPYSEEWVVGFHRQQREAWRPDAWDLELGVWASGKLAGVQAVYGKDFAESRVVGTGSWLGSGFQRQGDADGRARARVSWARCRAGKVRSYRGQRRIAAAVREARLPDRRARNGVAARRRP